MTIYRTHKCDELSIQDIGKNVTLSGWLHNKRDHGGILFIDLRDNYGITQVVIQPDSGFLEEISHLRKESVLKVEGVVSKRSDDTVNMKLATGEIEVIAKVYEILGKCDDLPFPIFPEEEDPEETRLKYRYLDLRKSKVHENILLRSKVIYKIRTMMTEMGFHEIQTPILTASSPEGARDYLVPSRLHPGQFYALPQAPQQYKQLLMVAGFDRYFQIAPCFRDEDARATRSPGEFYQLDIEMSFVTQEEIFEVIEKVLTSIFDEFSNKKVTKAPFPRIKYKEAMIKYGTDKPDLRNPLEIKDLTDFFRETEFQIFKKVINNGGVVRGIAVKSLYTKPKNFFDRLLEFAQSLGSRGLAYLIWEPEQVKGPIAKVLSAGKLEELRTLCGIGTEDGVFFICNEEAEAARIAGEIRIRLGQDLDLLERDVYKFCWIIDYPMYEYDSEKKGIIFSHNPFSMPQGGLKALESGDPLDILAYQYDIVCNGIELSSGAIRNHDPEIMYKAFDLGGYTREEVDGEFGAMIEAFKLGAPPHGGIAPGIDRILMLLTDEANIREVIAFPMNQKAQEPMMNSPRKVSKKQLKELHIRIVEGLDSL
ncbi:MAG: aspartate--tRNA ligase [Spirochaetales bacterium]|nr:aspartate--tRNA ligase [Spirochaetales bacterium]